jgi:hypothetical protein
LISSFFLLLAKNKIKLSVDNLKARPIPQAINQISRFARTPIANTEKKMNPHTLTEQLSIIITTSPIKSHPSTSLIDQTINSFKRTPHLIDCPIIILCDGFKTKSSGNKNEYKSCVITEEVKEKYLEFISRLKKKYLNEEPSNEEINENISNNDKDDTNDKKPSNVTIIVQNSNFGFSSNVKFGLEKVLTPFVMIVQHDQVFQRFVNIEKVIESMTNNSDIHYVGMMSCSDRQYINKNYNSNSKFNSFYKDLEKEINDYVNTNEDFKNNIHVQKLINAKMSNNEIRAMHTLNNNNNNNNSNDNPESTSGNVNTKDDTNENNNNIDSFKFSNDKSDDKFSVSQIIIDYYTSIYGVPLMPIFFWYDKTHICRTTFYKDFVFNTHHIDYSVTNLLGSKLVDKSQLRNLHDNGNGEMIRYVIYSKVLYNI